MPNKKSLIVVPFVYEWGQTDFYRMTLSEKMSRIDKEIRNVWEKYHAEQPNSHIIILWPEYLFNITYLPSEERHIYKSLDSEEEGQLKKILQSLAKECNNLVIVAGTVMTENPLDQGQLDEICEAYNNLAWIKSVDRQKKVENFTHEMENVMSLAKSKPTPQTLSEYSVIKNTCHVFFDDQIMSLGKMAPINEMKAEDKEEDPFSKYIYAVPGENADFALFSIKNPAENNETILAVDICRTHDANIAKRLTASALDDDDPPADLHLVVSHGINLDPRSVVGRCPLAILTDSRVQPSLTVCRLEPTEHQKVRVISHPLLSDLYEEHSLPAGTDRCSLLDMITHAIRRAESVEEKSALKEAKKKIENFPNEKNLSKGCIETLKKIIESLGAQESKHTFNLFKSTPPIRQFCEDAGKIIDKNQTLTSPPPAGKHPEK